MAVKVKIARPPAGSSRRTTVRRELIEKLLAVVGICVSLVLLVLGITFSYYNSKYTHVVDERLAKPLFTQTARIYAAPQELRTGQKLSASSIAQQLRGAGYSEGRGGRGASQLGTFSLGEDTISVRPGPQSYHSEEGATVTFKDGRIESITGDNGQALGAYELEPQLITGLSEGETAPSATWSPTPSCRRTSSRPSPPSKTAASSITAASTTSAW